MFSPGCSCSCEAFLSLSAACLERAIESRIDPPRVALVDRRAIGVRQGAASVCPIDVALRVVVVMARLRIDAAHRADHLRGEQDVLYRDHVGQQVDARLVVDTGVEVDVVQQVVRQQGFLELLRQAAETAPVVGHGAAAVRYQKTQGGELLEQVAGQALHESRGVGVEVVRAGSVKTRVATGGHMDHGRDVVLDHLLVQRVPVFVAQGRRVPVAAARVRVEIDAHVAVLRDAFLQFRDAGGRVHPGRLGQHRGTHEVVRKQLRHAVAELVADSSPGGRHVEIANMVRHEAGARRKDGEVGAALTHELELVGLD